jgi:hypothetical protein
MAVALPHRLQHLEGGGYDLRADAIPGTAAILNFIAIRLSSRSSAAGSMIL